MYSYIKGFEFRKKDVFVEHVFAFNFYPVYPLRTLLKPKSFGTN